MYWYTIGRNKLTRFGGSWILDSEWMSDQYNKVNNGEIMNGLPDMHEAFTQVVVDSGETNLG